MWWWICLGIHLEVLCEVVVVLRGGGSHGGGFAVAAAVGGGGRKHFITSARERWKLRQL